MNLLRKLARKFPLLKRLALRVLGHTRYAGAVSTNYQALKPEESDEEARRLRDSWQSQEIPARQRALVDEQLKIYASGGRVSVFDVLARAVRELETEVKSPRVLEVGCSSGFYSEVFQIAGLDVKYEGCDYSSSFIDLARSRYPAVPFAVEDATALSYQNCAFDIVISGCCLLHIPEYEAAIAETARVARSFAIFHRTPVVIGRPNAYYRKLAYGVETVEIHFSEPDLLRLFEKYGLLLIDTLTLDENVNNGEGTANRTYVCKKSNS